MKTGVLIHHSFRYLKHQLILNLHEDVPYCIHPRPQGPWPQPSSAWCDLQALIRSKVLETSTSLESPPPRMFNNFGHNKLGHFGIFGPPFSSFPLMLVEVILIGLNQYRLGFTNFDQIIFKVPTTVSIS